MLMTIQSACILDYGSGNVRSVFNILNYLDYNVIVSNAKRDIEKCSHVILPGVGAFGSSIEKIMKAIPFEALENEILVKGKPFLGICVGMQVLADEGHEFGVHKGFGWIPGVVKKLVTHGLPLPQIGWNDLIIDKSNKLFNNLNEYRDFYFVHSYVFETFNKEHVVARTEYGSLFSSAICKDNIYGIQFHPEKSQKAGQLLLKNFMSL
jgi:imidazole glycerol-phosphate synthase subunit HisH